MLQFLLDTLARTADLALIALGLSLVYGLAKFPNVAHVQYAMLGAFIAVALQRSGWPLPLAVGASCVLMGSLAVLLHIGVFRRLLRSGPAIAMIGSLALSMIIGALVLGIAGSSPLSYRLPIEAPWSLGDAMLARSQLLSMITTLVLLVLFALLLFKTRLGRSMRALACNAPLAAAAGLNADGIIYWVNFMSGALAALGGSLLAMNTSAYTNLGSDLLLPIFAAAILGGLGNPLGAVLGALLIALTETLVTNLNVGWLYGQAMAFIPVSYIGAASFLILLLALIFRPYGLFDREVRRV
ncbi:branched-chain amino acid ABC transporter permease [Pseudomonas sp. MWU16-30317]|uniref:branched-chain amino acid ABC transporter permease n=1 Tax=Pseudomonas sp. MWU16-30317 TaxID=2878095 RepID=UPI001CFA0284|nr:branched-chain amino acid ABC transporter permease [Pseudomonas sp. MWU16-30317]